MMNQPFRNGLTAGELSGIRFTLTHEDPSVPEKEIVTDQYGYAATKTQELVYGTWTLREDPSTTPEGYAGLERGKDPNYQKRCAGKVCCDQQCAECNDQRS